MSKRSVGFYTKERVSVEQRIEEGATKFLTNQFEAKEFADQKRSYPYPVYNFKGEQIGYGIPK